TSISCNSLPSAFAALSACCKKKILGGFSEFQKITTRETLGSASLSSSNCLWLISGAMLQRPVTLLPERLRLATNFEPTGSPDVTMTMGIVLVAFIAAAVAVEFVATIMSTGMAASWFANP